MKFPFSVRNKAKPGKIVIAVYIIGHAVYKIACSRKKVKKIPQIKKDFTSIGRNYFRNYFAKQAVIHLLKSMTGFGRGQAMSDQYAITAEIKAVNHRFLEISLRMPGQFNQLEAMVKKTVQSRLSRGKADIFILFEQVAAKKSVVKVDKELAIAYHIALSELAQACALPAEIKLAQVAALPGVLSLKNAEDDLEEISQLLSQAVEGALAQLLQMRQREGAALAEDLAAHLRLIEEKTFAIAELAPLVVSEQRQRLNDRLAEMLGAVEVDQARLANELAFFADKVDISEELTRLASHTAQFRHSLASAEPIGRKLEFILQEMLREINTIGSKSNALAINQAVIEVKSELEKIREQIQNIE